jgi:hypothetical protein
MTGDEKVILATTTLLFDDDRAGRHWRVPARCLAKSRPQRIAPDINYLDENAAATGDDRGIGFPTRFV